MVWHIGDFEERYSVDIFGGHICDAGFQLGVFISWNFKTRTKKTFVLHMMIFSRLLKGLTLSGILRNLLRATLPLSISGLSRFRNASAPLQVRHSGFLTNGNVQGSFS